MLSSCSSRSNDQTKIEYYKNGTIKSLLRYEDSKLNGECTWFYPNGMLDQKMIYKNGKANGNSHYFYPSGALKSHRYWRDDKMVGFVADYWDDTVGIIKSSLFFDNNGNLIYKKDFDPHGNIVNEQGRLP